MDKTRQIPSALILQWEQEAISQKIPYTEFGNFINMKERLYWQSQSTRKERPQIFANSARNKLTEYGKKVAFEHFLAIPLVERVCKFAKFDLEELQRKLSRGFEDETQKEKFIWERDHWFMRLKEKMKENRISKETLESFGLNWKECKTFAYQTL